MKDTGETGPIYDVPLVDALPIGNGMTQAMPSRHDLERSREGGDRLSAGYEVLLGHYRQLSDTGITGILRWARNYQSVTGQVPVILFHEIYDFFGSPVAIREVNDSAAVIEDSGGRLTCIPVEDLELRASP